MKKLLVLTVLFFLLSVTNLFADCTTTISGGIIVNQTWTQEGSPYCVDGDIFVESLVIEPGVRVEFSGNYVLEVEGVLTAIGSEGAPILFTKADAADGWQGILFDHTPAGSQLKHCQIEYSINSGIRIIDSIQVIENCSIANNHSDNRGGGISISLTSSTNELVLKECRICSNTSLTHGGGIYINASTGSLTLMNCEINNNRNNKDYNNGNYHGGGIYCVSAAAKLSLINCEVRDNYAYSRCRSRSCGAACYGGGVYVSKGNILFKNCIIDSNSSTASAGGDRTEYGYSYGAGIYQSKGALLLTNCIISNNSPVASGDKIYEYGGGVYTADATISIENCTIAYNTKQGIFNSDGIVTAINSIVYWNSGTQFSGNAMVTYSDVEMPDPMDIWPGEGNINADPFFENLFTLKIRCDYSPCVDAGSPQPWYNDLYFPPSCKTERNDMGAHGGPLVSSCDVGYCEGDFDKDGDVDSSDLAVFAADFGRTDCCPR